MNETSDFLSQYGQAGVFFLFGTLFFLLNLGVAWLVRPRGTDPLFRTTYECGMESVGGTQVRVNVRFYAFALLFVLFDVETMFIYPWAVSYRQLGLTGFLEMFVFLGVLMLGLAYAWKKGALKWES
jgi:NADH:ubiquinone oxidoreductase subunit 3 (subunit A)